MTAYDNARIGRNLSLLLAVFLSALTIHADWRGLGADIIIGGLYMTGLALILAAHSIADMKKHGK
jgi:hypothetical protein